MSPDEGYGPADAGYSGGVSPFSAFDNRIRYNDMIRKQMISQYQQNTVRPSTMTLSQQRSVTTDPRFQYGVAGGQDQRTYQRQAEMSRMSYGSALLGTAVDIAGWQTAAGGVAAAGLTGTMATIGIPLAVTMAGGHFLSSGVRNAVKRQKFMHSMAADVEQYRDQLGFNEPLTYKQATSLGRNLAGGAYEQADGGYFNTEQVSRIHKIGLSNKMLSAGGGGPGNAGTMRQYERNVKDLTETTEEVVKLLQTTIEGGMSVIKELQQTGFGSMRQIKQQVRQAKAFGGITGLGAQNMMQIGAAGARSVQGTPWESNVGSTMYQTGAANAAHMQRLGGGQAYAVQQAGGVAAAGGAIGRFQMNVLSSGMGTAATSYAMNTDGSVDNTRMERLLSGRASAYDIVTGGAQRGYGMGISGRVLFEKNKADMLNQMNDVGRAQMTNRLFEAWGSQRGGNADAKAWSYAGQFTNNQREQRLMQQYLLNPKGFDVQYGANRAVEAGMQDIDVRRARYTGPTSKAFGRVMSGAGDVWNRVGSDIVYGGGKMMGAATDMFGDVGRGFSTAYEVALQGMGIAGSEGVFNRAKYGDPSAAMRRQYSIGYTASQGGVDELESEFGAYRIKSKYGVKKSDLGVNWGKFMARTSQKDLKYIYQQMNVAQWGDTADTLSADPEILRIMKQGGISNAKKHLNDNPISTVNALTTGVNGERDKSVSRQKEYTAAWKTASDGKDSVYESKKSADEYLRRARIMVSSAPGAVSSFMAGNKHPIFNSYDIMSGITGMDARSEKWKPAFTQAFSEGADKRTDAGTRSFAMDLDIERAVKEADTGFQKYLGIEAETATIQTSSRLLGNMKYDVERLSAQSRKKAGKFRDIFRQYTKLKTGEGEEVRLSTEAGRSRARTLIQKITDESGEEFQDLKSQLAKQVSNNKDETGAWLGGKGYAELKEMEAKFQDVETAKAYQIRRGQSNRFVAYLEGGLRKQVTDKQKSSIKDIMIFGGSTGTIDAIAAGGDPSGIVELMAEGMTVSKERVREMAKDPSLLRASLAGAYAAKSKQSRTGLDTANEELKRWKVRESQVEFIKKPKEQAEEAAEVAAGMSQAQMQYDKLIQSHSYDDSGRGKTSYANVQPPILNYWNNKWSL